MDKAKISARIMTFLENGRKEITTKEELEKFAIGSLISYMNMSNIFKLGGFITKFAEEYFIYVTPDFVQKYRVRYINVKTMWVGDVYKVFNDIVSITKTKKKKTNFSVKVNKVVVYYARNNFDLKRFISTSRYKKIIEWCNYFSS